MNEVLAAEAVRDELACLTGWDSSLDGKSIEKSWTFADFARALAFVNAVGALAEAANHHPDIEFGWGKARVSLSTHSAGGITRKDVDLAVQIDAIVLS